jgi:hypothetical protein
MIDLQQESHEPQNDARSKQQRSFFDEASFAPGENLQTSVEIERVDNMPLFRLAAQAQEAGRPTRGDKGYEDAYSKHRLGKLSLHIKGSSS